MSLVKTFTTTIPAGDYWLGDPCYVIADDAWTDWLENAGVESGDYFGTIPDTDCIAVGLGTMYGDGEYYDQQGRAYPVDAGMIGLVPRHYGEPTVDDGVHAVTFADDTECYATDRGLLVFGDISIRTDE